MLVGEKTTVPGEMKLYSVEDVAELLDVSKKLVYAWVSDGDLPAKRLGPGGRLIRIGQADLKAFIDKDFREG
jgi:excisionase family DNA binding protein